MMFVMLFNGAIYGLLGGVAGHALWMAEQIKEQKKDERTIHHMIVQILATMFSSAALASITTLLFSGLKLWNLEEIAMTWNSANGWNESSVHLFLGVNLAVGLTKTGIVDKLMKKVD